MDARKKEAGGRNITRDTVVVDKSKKKDEPSFKLKQKGEIPKL